MRISEQFVETSRRRSESFALECFLCPETSFLEGDPARQTGEGSDPSEENFNKPDQTRCTKICPSQKYSAQRFEALHISFRRKLRDISDSPSKIFDSCDRVSSAASAPTETLRQNRGLETLLLHRDDVSSSMT